MPKLKDSIVSMVIEILSYRKKYLTTFYMGELINNLNLEKEIFNSITKILMNLVNYFFLLNYLLWPFFLLKLNNKRGEMSFLFLILCENVRISQSPF